MGANIRPRGGDVRAGDDGPRGGRRRSRRAARRARGLRARRGRRAPAPARRDRRHRHRAARRRARRSSPGQIYESNGIMLAAALEAAGAVVERLAPAEDTEARIGRRSPGRSRPTSSSPRAASRSARTTSSAACEARARRRGGVLGRRHAAGQAARLRRPRARRSSSGCPGTPSPRSSAPCSSSRPALLALQGHPDPAPPFRPGTLARAGPPRPERDDFVRARISWSEAGPSSTRSSARSRT